MSGYAPPRPLTARMLDRRRRAGRGV